MKAVIDTNVLISGIYFGGAPAKIVDLWLQKAFLVFVTPSIIVEYLRVIDHFSTKKEPLLEQNWKTLLPEICHILPDEEKAIPLCREKMMTNSYIVV